MSARRVVRFFVEGGVQGVGYRAFLVREANALGLDGWTRNRRDGSVEAVVAGPEASVAALIDAARRGPRHARVTCLREEPAQDADLGAAAGFGIAPTA